jgi:DNA-directed RNA polymerase sigma subunit (sigma70/sigma32)
VSQDSGAGEELAALSRALDRIAAMPGSHAKTAAIRQLAEELDKLTARTAEIRRAEVLRIRDEEQLTLAPLAERVGMSKARAGQIVKAEERRQEEARNA